MEAIVDALAEQNAELAGLLSGRSEEEALQPSACEGWTVNDVVLHLAQTNEIAQASVEGRFFDAATGFGGTGGAPVHSVDDWAELSVDAERSVPWSQVRERWERSVQGMEAAFRAGDPSARVQWVAGDMAARTLATTRLAETWIHTGDAAYGFGITPEPAERLVHVARLAWRTLPYAFTRAGREPPGPVAFALVGPSGDRWDFG
ncbi:MAG: maleylpyruvate isomerase family mycothiol-dependent enzyme, partial [Actinomycetota bacterium]